MEIKEKDAIRFIDRLYRDLYKSNEVLHYSNGDDTDKFGNLERYLDSMGSLHNKVIQTGRHIKLIKEMLYKQYIIKEEDIPEDIYELYDQNKHDGRPLSEDDKQSIRIQIILDQKSSLDIWIDYFLNEKSNIYPFWLKYWAFQGMIRIGSVDKKTGKCTRRTKNTVYRFLDFNEEVLSRCMDLVLKVLGKETIDDKELEQLVRNGSFEKIYSHVMTNMINNAKEKPNKNEGKWIKFEKGSDYKVLVNALSGYNTGWCIAGEGTAEVYLYSNDVYIYCTMDENGEYKIPRIALIAGNGIISQVRGVLKHQHLEPEFELIVEEKAKEFGNSELIDKRISDSKKIGIIYDKVNNNEELSVEELQFIYEIDYKRSSFGLSLDSAWWELDDPRIEKIRDKRNIVSDLNTIFSTKKSFKKSIELPYLRNVEGLILPESIEDGYIYFGYISGVDKMILPDPLTYTIYYCERNDSLHDDKIITPENVNDFRKKK